MSRRIALLIGNTEYSDSFYNRLVTPGKNVRDLERVLKDKERCGFDVITLTNTSKAEAERQILELFKNKVQDDFIIMYFSGHGLKDADGALYFAMQDTDRDAIEVTAVSASFIKSRIEKSFSERIVVILDCCFSGAFGGTMSGLGEAIDIQREFDGHGYSKIILTATDAMQYAWDRNTDEVFGNADNSVFTKYIVEGISTGEADRNSDGEITVDELFSYVYERTVRTFPKQTPKKIIYQADNDLVIAHNPSINRLSIELTTAINNPSHITRMGAVHGLEELLYLYDGQNNQLVSEILTALQRLSSDRNQSVSQLATSVLAVYEERDVAKIISGEVKRLTVFVSSPGDVKEEREAVRSLVHRLNQDEAISSLAELTTVAWDDPENPVPMYAHESPQVVINAEMLKPSQCDIVIVIFWARMGTPLSADIVKKDGTRYESGTEWEFEDAVQAAKQNNGRPTVLVYRSNRPIIRPGEVDIADKIAQFQKVEQFFLKFSDDDGSLKGGYNVYDSLEQFQEILEKHLRIVIRRLVTELPGNTNTTPPTTSETKVKSANDFDITAIIEPYLNWIVEQHSQLELRGLGGDARLPTIPLEKVYVALKGSRSSGYERQQSHELLQAEMSDILDDLEEEFSARELASMMYFAERRAIIINPHMPSLIERDRPDSATEQIENITLGEAFQHERWMVILGDPGSGKTTLARWIALKLASALLNEEISVVVPAYQIDPRKGKDDTSTVNIGPSRLPVLVRVSEFSEAYQDARRSHETLSLADFLGSQSWLGQHPNIPPEALNALIKQYLRQGKAVIILDGMDEITAASQRDDVVRAIEVFINDWINARGQSRSMHEKSALWDPFFHGDPATSGGNQIIITSRIAGYQASPITGQVTHVTVQPMQRIAVEHFCDSWTLAVFQLLYPKELPENIEREAEREANKLKAAIFDPHRPRVRELASNPLLVTILALVFRNNQGRLPEQRVELYHTAMEILIEEWRTAGITTVELIYVLSPLAAHIHQHYATGLIEESELRELITEELANYRQLDIYDLPPSFVLEVNDFIRRVREDVGLLSERSEQLYGFLHLTFQEYLAALYLVRDKRVAAAKVVDKLNDPRWREPIMMALGHISVNKDWGPKARQKVLTELLEADDPLGDLIPRSALLIVSAIPEMARVPESVISQVVRSLLLTYADRDGAGSFESLRDKINQGIKNLHASNHQHLVERFLTEALRNIDKGDRNLAMAAADIVVRNKWYSDEIVRVLIDGLPYDLASWGNPIATALKNFVVPDPEALPTPPKPPELTKKENEELSKLEATLQQLEDGSRAREIEDQISEIEANFNERWEAYKKHIVDTEIEPRRKQIEKIKSGERENELRIEKQKLQEQLAAGTNNGDSQADEASEERKNPFSIDSTSRLERRLQNIDDELSAIVSGEATKRLNEQIWQYEKELEGDRG